MVRSQRKGAVAIALQVVALQPARILAAKDRPAAEWPFRSLWTRGEGWGRARDLTQSAQLRDASSVGLVNRQATGSPAPLCLPVLGTLAMAIRYSRNAPVGLRKKKVTIHDRDAA